MKLTQSIIAAIFLLIGCWGLLFETTLNDFPQLIGFYFIAFVGYFFALKSEAKIALWICLGFLIRLMSLVAFPGLSDDIYRFIWDGWLITEGINPFASLPTDVKIPLNGYQEFLLDKMNSPNYYSVYPTILQGIFALTVLVIPAGLFYQSVFMKVILLTTEIIGVYFGYRLLKKLEMKKGLILLYFLNPLVIVELMGNMHMEIVMIAGFSFFLWAWHEKLYVAAAFGLTFSVAAKLITILVSPFLLKRRKLGKIVLFGLFVAVMLLALFLPLFISTYENFGKGLDLYFQKFEFNASIYYILRSIGYWFKGYNIIGSLGPALAMISALTILFLAWREKSTSIQSLCRYLTFGLSAYYFMGTTIHPWYTSLLVFLAIFSDLRYPIYWSFLVVFSYAKYYQDGRYYLICVALEYISLLVLMILEYRNVRKFKLNKLETKVSSH